MATKWKDLKHKASPETRETAKREALAEHAELEGIGVGAIRAARQQTQVAVAEQMQVPQSAVSRLENQSDCLLSTLRKYVGALGGTLEVRAVFPDGAVELDGLEQKPGYCKVSEIRYVGFFLGKKPVGLCGSTLHLPGFCSNENASAAGRSDEPMSGPCSVPNSLVDPSAASDRDPISDDVPDGEEAAKQQHPGQGEAEGVELSRMVELEEFNRSRQNA
jgi:hypothetical protein